ncbi:MAG: BatD family protein [Kiritimatiellae bacterium]|nr:BatD family protein [Kiritimatiellia bacterium]
MKKAFILVCAIFATLSLCAGEIVSGRLYTEPATIYRNQPFKLWFELQITFGCELQDVRPEGLPGEADSLVLGKWEPGDQSREVVEGKQVYRYRFSATARCTSAVRREFHPSVTCTLAERQGGGFFNVWRPYARSKALSPFLLEVRELPPNAPENYGGAVGKYRLTGKLSENKVQPGDIITLTLDLRGNGWMGDGKPPTPPADACFKTYPVKETVRSAQRITTQQIWIPQSTNATEIGRVSFPFFNPESGRYETAEAGPFPLTFVTRTETVTNEVVQVLAEPENAQTPLTGIVTLEQVNETVQRMKPLLVFAFSLLLAGFLFFALYGKRTKLGIAIAVAVLILGGVLAMQTGKSANANQLTIGEKTEVRFAPSVQAQVLFSLPPNSSVTLVETAGTWYRIDFGGRRGWIEMRAAKGGNEK